MSGPENPFRKETEKIEKTAIAKIQLDTVPTEDSANDPTRKKPDRSVGKWFSRPGRKCPINDPRPRLSVCIIA